MQLKNTEPRVYILEDDSNIQELVVYSLEHSGFKASGFSRPSEFWEALREGQPDLVLLDVMLPEEDGLDVLKKLREAKGFKRLPVIMLTAKTTEYDKVLGLDTGADDYLTKPFGIMELIARIKALLRRSKVREEPESLTIGKVELIPEKHKVLVSERKIKLTGKEYELLRYLMENQEIVVSRERLLDRIWGYDYDGESRTVDVHIRSLRKKLGEGAEIIQTVRGFGYLAAPLREDND